MTLTAAKALAAELKLKRSTLEHSQSEAEAAIERQIEGLRNDSIVLSTAGESEAAQVIDREADELQSRLMNLILRRGD